MARVATYGNIPTVGRKLRNPQHRFSLISFPYQIQPFLIAPVLPGETLKNLLIQARVITDTVKSQSIGWWNEYYIFYVKHRDLDGRDDFTEMMLDLEKDMSAYDEAADVKYHHHGGTINWAKLCLNRVVEEYFRDEGDTGSYTIGGMPAAAVNIQNWLDSARLGDVDDGVDVDVDLNADSTITTGEIDNAYRTWEFLNANAMTKMSYDEWLATYGVKTAKVELHKPELIRYIREWQYPTLDSRITSSVTTADQFPAMLQWSIRDRADKDRFFKEPGFIFGVTVTRPKAFLKNIDGSAVDSMVGALAWLPALLRDDPRTSMVRYGPTEGPLAGVVTDTEGYTFDVKDLLLYGDDFVNYTKAVGTGSFVDLPNAGLTNKDFPSETDMQGLFMGSTDATRRVRSDGVVTLSILGTQQDTSPTVMQGM